MITIDLRHRVAIVTGARRRAGIGAAIARALAEAVARIFITHYAPYDVTTSGLAGPEGPDAVLDELRQITPQVAGMALDLARPDAAPALFDAAESALGAVSILVNNATHSERHGIDA